ncbi:MAG TPA: phosphoglycerate kinase [Thermoanaerobaculia bacterium]|nr:phosphoglycerate kinase [Thermoanaerobaculia bacterium]
MIEISAVDELELTGQKIFYRVDYNVPMEKGEISDTTRIEETLPTLLMMRERGAVIIIASHLGRPKGKRNEEYSLRPVRDEVADLLNLDIQWADDCVGPEVEAKASSLGPGQILMLENLRFHAEEEGNDDSFARSLRKLADVYVNDAFGACHRAHASIVALPNLYEKGKKAGGLLLVNELRFLQKITHVSDRPFVAVLGGAKIAGKIEPLEALVKLADKVLVGGGMANTFLASQGTDLGASLVDAESKEIAARIIKDGGDKVILPVDLVVTDSIENATNIRRVDVTDKFGSADRAVDIGPKTVERFAGEIAAARTIFWNGPMGVFEKEEFAAGTRAVAQAVAAANAISVVGGGESVEAAKSSGHSERISHISTGGGASLEFIAGSELPGVQVLRKDVDGAGD